MPSDWYSPTLDLVAALAWPAVVLFLLVVFRRNVGRFIDEVSEFSGFGASAKRQGNRRSADLQAATREDLADGDSIDEADGEGAAVEATDPTPPEEPGIGVAIDAAAAVADPIAFLRFYRRFALSRVRAYRTNSETSSTRLAGEIVRSAYVTLRTDIRIVAFLRGGPSVTASRTTGRLVAPQATLARVGAPATLIALVVEARALALAVEDGTTKLDGRGALAFIDAVEQITRELFDWAEAEAEAEAQAEAQAQAQAQAGHRG
jgi:hypothetical protein